MATSSSETKPCAHHTSAVVAAALAMKGRAKVPAAAAARELRSTDRRLRFPMSLPSLLAHQWAVFTRETGTDSGGVRSFKSIADLGRSNLCGLVQIAT